MGLTSADMLAVVASLSSVSRRRGGDFFKSMTTFADHTLPNPRSLLASPLPMNAEIVVAPIHYMDITL